VEGTEVDATLPDRAVLDLELGSVDLLERMGVPVLVTRIAPGEDRSRTVFANDAAVRLLGYERDELVGRGPELWQSPARGAADARAITAALRAGNKVRMATVARSKDGTERGLRVEMVPHDGSWGLWVVGTVVWISDEDPEDTGRIRIARERPAHLSVGGITLETALRRVRYDQAAVALTPSECLLLGTLMHEAGCVVERTVLYEELWGFDPSVRSRAIDVYIASLRRKLGAIGAPEVIHTVRGVGYVFHD
jgi:PAS domain S-box-containing protein